jgi:hypothetical protein
MTTAAFARRTVLGHAALEDSSGCPETAGVEDDDTRVGVARRQADPGEVLHRGDRAAFDFALVDGWAIAGLCLIRLEQLRPAWLPAQAGISSESVAYRGSHVELEPRPVEHPEPAAPEPCWEESPPGGHLKARYQATLQ